MAIAFVTFICVFSGALLGMVLQRVLPERHLSGHSKDLVKLAMGLIATMSALVLSLLIASAKTSYDRESVELTQISAKLVVLDRVLAHCGSEAMAARDQLRRS